MLEEEDLILKNNPLYFPSQTIFEGISSEYKQNSKYKIQIQNFSFIKKLIYVPV